MVSVIRKIVKSVAMSIKQATCITKACYCTCPKQAAVLSKHILIVPKVPI